MNEITTTGKDQLIFDLVTKGDVSKLTDAQRAEYYTRTCESLGLNPITRPFDFISLNGRLVLYAKKDATEQLRKINGVSVESMESKTVEGVFIVSVKVKDAAGRTDIATGAVNIANLKGDALANALMKAETKAKRRATLSICGLGILDETEIETIPQETKAQEPKNVTPAPKQIEKQEEPKTAEKAKKKGNFVKAIESISAVKTRADMDAIRAKLNEREWTPDEHAKLKAAIIAHKTMKGA